MKPFGGQGDIPSFISWVPGLGITIPVDPISDVGPMDLSRKGDGSSNVPFMHLFMYLKRKFPSLKDSHITDSIQRFGLDKSRCEEELNRRSNDQHKGYNSPWNRSRASSRSSTGSRNSPLSPSDCSPHISFPMQNGSASSTTISSEPMSPFEVEKERVEHPSEISLLETSSDIYTKPAKAVYSSASNSQVLTSPAYNDSRRIPRQPVNNGPRATNGFVESKGTQNTPKSAPVIPNSFDESVFQIPPALRRSSAETVSRQREMLYLDPNLLRQVSPPNFPPGDGMDTKGIPSPSLSPSTPTNTTTTMSSSSTTPLPVTTRTVFSYPAAIKEQISRRERLKEVLARRIEEKVALEGEVRDLSKELEEKQRAQRVEVIKNKKEIKQIQEENGRYQCACDEMEREILESGESPKTDQERQAAQRDPPPTPHRPAPQPPIASGSSFSGACSGAIVPPSNVLHPTRRAPSPPINVAGPNHGAPGQGDQASQRPGIAVINDDCGKDWSCSKCTLINSSYLNECELCGFPHFSIGTPPTNHQLPHQNPISSAPNPGGPCYCHHRHHYNLNHEHRSAGELQDIHIQVRHQSLHSPMREI